MTEGRDASPVPRAERHLLLADLEGALHQLFSITFARNGICVNFPTIWPARAQRAGRRSSPPAPSPSTWTP